MNTQAVNIIIALLAALGVFFLAGGLTGWLGKVGWGKNVSLLQEDRERDQTLPLAARLAHDISQALPIETDKEPIERRLSQAGNPYDSPAHFYQRKFAYMILFAVIAVVVCYFLGVPALMTLALAIIAALFGLYAPDSEVNDRIKKRREALRREMAFMLDRVSYALMAYGTLQEALARMGTAYSEEDEQSRPGMLIPSSPRGDEKQRQRMATMGTTLTGMGGGLFAEYLNRLASMLLSSAEERFDKIRDELALHYPSSPEIQNFLDIVESGLRGAPMTEHLFELADTMISDLAQEQREAGMRATAIVVAAAGLILIPLLLVVGGPAFTLAISVFAP
jgi:hypothetical protein